MKVHEIVLYTCIFALGAYVIWAFALAKFLYWLAKWHGQI